MLKRSNIFPLTNNSRMLNELQTHYWHLSPIQWIRKIITFLKGRHICSSGKPKKNPHKHLIHFYKGTFFNSEWFGKRMLNIELLEWREKKPCRDRTIHTEVSKNRFFLLFSLLEFQQMFFLSMPLNDRYSVNKRTEFWTKKINKRMLHS